VGSEKRKIEKERKEDKMGVRERKRKE